MDWTRIFKLVCEKSGDNSQLVLIRRPKSIEVACLRLKINGSNSGPVLIIEWSLQRKRPLNVSQMLIVSQCHYVPQNAETCIYIYVCTFIISVLWQAWPYFYGVFDQQWGVLPCATRPCVKLAYKLTHCLQRYVQVHASNKIESIDWP